MQVSRGGFFDFCEIFTIAAVNIFLLVNYIMSLDYYFLSDFNQTKNSSLVTLYNSLIKRYSQQQ